MDKHKQKTLSLKHVIHNLILTYSSGLKAYIFGSNWVSFNKKKSFVKGYSNYYWYLTAINFCYAAISKINMWN